MSKPTRADLFILADVSGCWCGELSHARPELHVLSDETFDAIAREQGYVKNTDHLFVDQEAVAKDWIEQHPGSEDR